MDFQELLDLLHAVEDTLPQDIRFDANFAGLRLDDTGTTVSVSEFTALGISLESRLNHVPEFRRLADARGLQTSTEYAAIQLLSQCAAGDKGYTPVTNSKGFGTFGWIVCLDGNPACIGSHHVFCSFGDDSHRGVDVIYWADRNLQLAPAPVGTLYDFIPIRNMEPRVFDLAAVKFDDVRTIANLWTHWRARTGRPYPLRVSSALRIDSGGHYYVVGAGMCEDFVELDFKGIGTRKYAQDGDYFRDQLFLSPTDTRHQCRGGDSGAVIVHEGSNEVIGLVMMTSSGFTVANPLSQLPWKYNGTVVLAGIALPSLSTA